MILVYFLKYKLEALNCFKSFKASVENESDLKIKFLRSDGGGEFNSGDFNELFEKHGVKRKLSIARPPQQNGIAEIKNRSIWETTRIMLLEARLPIKLWKEAVGVAI